MDVSSFEISIYPPPTKREQQRGAQVRQMNDVGPNHRGKAALWLDSGNWGLEISNTFALVIMHTVR